MISGEAVLCANHNSVKILDFCLELGLLLLMKEESSVFSFFYVLIHLRSFCSFRF